MATIKGFKGMRFAKGDMNTLVCPPYDIISEEQRLKFIETDEHNIIRLELPTGENRYKEAGKTLSEWLSDGTLKQDNEDSIYVYEMEFTAFGERKSVKGFVSLVKLEEFSKGVVLPHEETLSKAKADRFNLMSETFCNFSQIYSLYMDDDNSVYSLVDNCSKGEPDMSVTDSDGTIHRMWRVYDESILSKLSKLFEDKKLYIADGHHRYETALNFHKALVKDGRAEEGDLSNYIMMMLVNMENEGLVVFPTHRIVRDLDNFDANKLLDGCLEYFTIEKQDNISAVEKCLNENYRADKCSFGFYDGASYTVLTLKDSVDMKNFLPGMSEAYCSLDVSVLHSLVLERIFGIDKENMANQINLTYTRDISEAISSVDDKKADCAFILNPTRVSEIRDVALAGEKMPQKSTYFYPKLITGLVMNKFK